MRTDQCHLIVEDALCASCSVHTTRVHHSDFPEIRAECGSVADGVALLVKHLKCARENAQSNWRHELIDRAIADATEFLNAMAEAGPNHEAFCRCVARIPDQIEPMLPERSTSL
ncbi:hypothetical protein SAMN05444166_6722 [Singulisphaera sp. GP187]|uniref:hypothetical protein n=1 Tax=Singulisphaera sp. GP187 TaxID=1882752 RepID=UPI0009292DCB|nr:hypothetical protein [Singulisphaera sp. GP187]SIO61323.1 hypothetical protein SAMN05444166_6722 [Singulisphaera sp. GP187]